MGREKRKDLQVEKGGTKMPKERLDGEPKINPLAAELSVRLFGSTEHGCCVVCKEEASVFRDDLSRKEWHISRMCQVCQDEVFGV